MIPRIHLALWRACAVLVGAVAVAYPLVALIAVERSDGPARVVWVAAAVAAGVCCFSATLSLVLSQMLQGSGFKKSGAANGSAVTGLLAGMLVRLGLPLAVGTMLKNQGGPLADAGVFGLIVVFYLITLVVETRLSLKLVQSDAAASIGSSAAGSAQHG